MERLNALKSEKVLETPCVGRDLGAKAERTLMQLGTGRDGVRTLDTLCLKGSTIEHVFH